MNYRLLDSGGGRKLEEVAGQRLDRQAPAAVWRPSLPRKEWERANGVHIRSERGGGHWNWKGPAPKSWTVDYGGLNLELKATPFGHLGLFAEQAAQWAFLRSAVEAFQKEQARAPKLLNLFAYTGGSTLAAAQAGAAVTHVDAAKGVVDWARRNADLNGLADRPVRWIVEDVIRFAQRAKRREDHYDGVILDPPSFGRGSGGELWKIEERLAELLDLCSGLVKNRPAIVLLSAHSPGYGALSLENLLHDHFDLEGKILSSGEMTVPEASGRPLPSGSYARYGSGLS
ncbi:MAG: class I SAM-dependent methyltransferase [Planctomycetota bacterium]